MSEKTASIILFILTVFTFFYGYGKDELHHALASTFLNRGKAQEEGSSFSEQALKEEAIPSQDGVSQPLPNPPSAQILSQKPGTYEASTKSPLLPSVTNAPKNSLNSALDSIQPSQIQEGQKAQRNLYFEKLSEQMRQLQQQQPSIAGTVNQNTAPLAPAPPVFGSSPSSPTIPENTFPPPPENLPSIEEEEDGEEAIDDSDIEETFDDQEDDSALDDLTAQDRAELERTLEQTY